MFKKLFLQCGQRSLSLQKQRFKKTEAFDYSQYLKGIKQALVIFPENNDAFSAAIKKQVLLEQLFAGVHFTYIVREQYFSLLPNHAKEYSFSLGADDLTVCQTPSRRFLKQFELRSFGMVLDLNVEFDLPSTYVAAKIDSNLRICLGQQPEREPYYNLQVLTHSDHTIEEQIATVFEYLDKLLHPAIDARSGLQPA